MQVYNKPKIAIETIETFLKHNYLYSITKINNLIEGEDSQAFYFEADNHKYVMRVNRSDYGFKKDAYSATHFAHAGIPIPKIHQIGMINKEYAYCISDFVEGKTLQDLDRASVEALLPDTLDMLNIIQNVDIHDTTGYGEIDLSGNGKSASWHEWLLKHISSPDFNWDEIVANGSINQEFLDHVFAVFKELVAKVPNERKLIQGDFSSNNILVNSNKIVAVLDWDSASYGDWLFDVAGAYYWRDHLMCMEVQANYYEQKLSHLPNYHERVVCYQIRAALIEMYVQAKRKEQQKLEWHINRCSKLLEEAKILLNK